MYRRRRRRHRRRRARCDLPVRQRRGGGGDEPCLLRRCPPLACASALAVEVVEEAATAAAASSSTQVPDTRRRAPFSRVLVGVPVRRLFRRRRRSRPFQSTRSREICARARERYPASFQILRSCDLGSLSFSSGKKKKNH